jgi:integrase
MLKLYLRPTGLWHIRGTVQGRRIDQSARTRIKAEAEAIRAQIEAETFKRAVYGDRAVATFAEAAADYMAAGGSSDHLTPLLHAIGSRRLSDLKQADVDRLARELKPTAKPATLIRQIYTPYSAVINYAATQGLCEPIRLRKPKVENNRVDYLTPAEAETLLAFLPPHLAQLVTFYLATGCRATEALDLEWRDVSPKGERVVFWETKGGYARGVPVQPRVILPERHDGFVWLTKAGNPWHGYDAINLALKRLCIKHKFRPVHCHLFRHTWATWAYAVTKDMTLLMQQGGWKSATMVMRYAHAGSDDLAAEILKKGWRFGRDLQTSRGRIREKIGRKSQTA